MNNPGRKILIIGVGNPLLADDGVGVYVIDELKKIPVPENVKLADCGTDVLKLLSFLEDEDIIVIVDAVDGKRDAGTIFHFNKEETLKFPGESKSAHLISVIDSLRLLEKVNPLFQKARLDFFGIQPLKVEMESQLSEPVKTSADKVISEIKDKYF